MLIIILLLSGNVLPHAHQWWCLLSHICNYQDDWGSHIAHFMHLCVNHDIWDDSVHGLEEPCRGIQGRGSTKSMQWYVSHRQSKGHSVLYQLFHKYWISVLTEEMREYLKVSLLTVWEFPHPHISAVWKFPISSYYDCFAISHLYNFAVRQFFLLQIFKSYGQPVIILKLSGSHLYHGSNLCMEKTMYLSTVPITSP